MTRAGSRLPPRFSFLSANSGILISNAITLAGAVFLGWPALPVMLIYWGQSVVIGITNVVRILTLEDFSTEGLTSNGRPVAANQQGKVSVARFFALHYGVFHLVYAIFLFHGGFGAMNAGVLAGVAFNVVSFAASHAWPFVGSGEQGYRGKQDLGTLMFYPYLRILPMHLAIILGSMFPQGALPIFIVLKTLADVGMHEVERKVLRGGTSVA